LITESYEKAEVDDDEEYFGASGAADLPRPVPARVAAAPLNGSATSVHRQQAPVHGVSSDLKTQTASAGPPYGRPDRSSH